MLPDSQGKINIFILIVAYIPYSAPKQKFTLSKCAHHIACYPTKQSMESLKLEESHLHTQ